MSFSNSQLLGYLLLETDFSAFLDLYLAVYPSIVLYKLQMNRKKKVALCGALGIGSMYVSRIDELGCCDDANTLPRATIVAVYKTTRLPSLASGDFTYSTSDLVVFTIAEGGTIIIAACIPVLQPLLEMLTGKRGWLSSDRTSGGRPYHQQQYGGRGGQSYMAEKSVRSEFEPRRRRLEDDDDLLMTSMEIERAQGKDGFWTAGQPPVPRRAALPSTPSRASSRTSIRAHPKAVSATRGIFSRPRRSEDTTAVPPVITKTHSIRVEYEPYTGKSGSWPLPQDSFPIGDDASRTGSNAGLVNQRSFSLSSVKSEGAWRGS